MTKKHERIKVTDLNELIMHPRATETDTTAITRMAVLEKDLQEEMWIREWETKNLALLKKRKNN
jgi:hypothetical protein